MAESKEQGGDAEHAPRKFELFDELMPVRRYKMLLQMFLKRRGSGSRQALADALGSSRSFVTQITSPAYGVPLPAQHISTIVDFAGLSALEERFFVEAYAEAHPDRLSELQGRLSGTETRTITLRLPILKNAASQAKLESLVQRTAQEIAEAMVKIEADASTK